MVIGYAGVASLPRRSALSRARGRLGGRPKALDTKKAQIAQALYSDKSNSIRDICRTLRISRSTLYRYVKTSA